MLSAYTYLDELLTQDIEPFSDVGMEHMLSLKSARAVRRRRWVRRGIRVEHRGGD
jgi:hypothetical protein